MRKLGLAGLLGLALGCSSGQDPELLLLSPSAPELRVGERVAFNLRSLEEPQGDPQWDVVEAYGGGLLQSRGFRVTYVAPAVAGLYHLEVRVPVASGAPLRQTLPIRVRASVQLDPPAVTLAPGASLVFALRQKGLPRGLATWRVEEPEGGSISPEGHYLAPAASGTYHITAQCPEDPGTTASATVTVR